MTALLDHRTHRLTVEAFEHLVAERDLENVELVDGVIYEVCAEYDLHATAAAVIDRLVSERHPGRKVLRGSVRIDDHSLWNPDVHVLDVGYDLIFPKYPAAANVLLAVEVSLTTWRHDAGPKLRAYARNGVPDYRMVDPRPGGRIVRYTKPNGSGYDSVESVPLPDGVASLATGWDAFELATEP